MISIVTLEVENALAACNNNGVKVESPSGMPSNGQIFGERIKIKKRAEINVISPFLVT